MTVTFSCFIVPLQAWVALQQCLCEFSTFAPFYWQEITRILRAYLPPLPCSLQIENQSVCFLSQSCEWPQTLCSDSCLQHRPPFVSHSAGTVGRGASNCPTAEPDCVPRWRMHSKHITDHRYYIFYESRYTVPEICHMFSS